MKRYNLFLPVCLFGLGLMTITRYLDNIHWLVTIFSHFPMQYALMSLVLLYFCIRKKRTLLAVLVGVLIVLNLSATIDFEGSIQAAGHVREPFKVYSANVHLKNGDLSRLNHELQELSPDVAMLLEVTPAHLDQLEHSIKTYPFYIKKIFTGELDIGFVFLSKFPVLDSKLTRLSDVCNFVLETTLEIDGKPVKFFAVHAQRPGITNFSERRDQFLQLAQQLKEQTLPVIVAGDFNATPYSPMLRQLIVNSGLRDSRTGFGWQPSWPTYVPFLWIPIDQILLSPSIQVHNRATGSYIGSDHYPVFAELSISN